jgi:hypothetical protein
MTVVMLHVACEYECGRQVVAEVASDQLLWSLRRALNASS